MKILVSSHTGNFCGGAENSLLLYLKTSRIPKDSFEVVIPRKGWLGDYRTELEKSGFRTKLILKIDDTVSTPFFKSLANPFLNLRRIVSIVRFIFFYCAHLRRFKPDVVYINTIRCATEALIARLLGFPVVAHVRGLEDGVASKLRIFAIYLTAKKIIVLSRDNKYALEQFSKKMRCRIEIIPNGIDLASLRIDNNTKTRIIQEYDLKGKNVIGMVGSVSWNKNPVTFCEIARRLISHGSNLAFVWVGHTDQTPEAVKIFSVLRQKYAQEMRENKIIFAGQRSNIFDWMDIFDIFCFTSLKEGLPRTVLEAMALGKPVLSFAIGGVVDIIQNNYDGLLVKPYDIDAIALKLEQLINDSDLRERLKSNARKKIESHFRMEDVAAAIDEAIIGAVNK